MMSLLQNKETPVLIAIVLNEDKILEELLENGADPNMVRLIRSLQDSSGETCVVITKFPSLTRGGLDNGLEGGVHDRL